MLRAITRQAQHCSIRAQYMVTTHHLPPVLPLTRITPRHFSTEPSKPQPNNSEDPALDSASQLADEKALKQKKRTEIRKKLFALIQDPYTKKLFWSTMALVTASKGMGLVSPWFLKGVIDQMALGSAVNLNMAMFGIGMFGLTRVLSTAFQEYRMWKVSQIIQHSVKKISKNCFGHMQSLDIDFHKTSSKNTVFAINRALRSIEQAMRFIFGFFTPIAIEFTLLSGIMYYYCGPKYLGNMVITLALYTYFSKEFSAVRRVQMAEKKNAEKKSEFYLNESTINYESVKNFNNEELEKSRYQKLVENLESKSLVVQKSLSELNGGQAVIFSTGMVLNMIMAARDVSLGVMTPGDFVLISTYFTQLSGPLFNMGMLFREVGQTQVDLEDLIAMLERQPKV